MRGSFTWRHADFFEFFFYGLKNYNRGMVFVEGFIYKLHGDMKSYFTNVKRVVLKEGWTSEGGQEFHCNCSGFFRSSVFTMVGWTME